MDRGNVPANLREQGHADVIKTMEDVDVLRPEPSGDEEQVPQQTALDTPEASVDSAVGSLDALRAGVRAGEDHEFHLRIVIRRGAKAGSYQIEGGSADPPSPR